MNLTEHFKLHEFINSPTAIRLKIDNTPTGEIISNLLELSQMLEKIREVYGKPIIIGSGYRCPKLNKAVGGVPNSQHQYGQAADIKTVSDSPKDNKVLFDICKRLVDNGTIKVGQLIDEYNYNWIHISTDHLKNKHNQILHIK